MTFLDCFRTNRVDPSISDTSSYLDLAPLYGSNLEDQLSIRTMQRGLLKPDSFAEKRLLGQPPGVNVMLVMYSRFHNYVADVLLNVNENGRFTLQPSTTEEGKKAALAKQDEDVFQTARLYGPFSKMTLLVLTAGVVLPTVSMLTSLCTTTSVVSPIPTTRLVTGLLTLVLRLVDFSTPRVSHEVSATRCLPNSTCCTVSTLSFLVAMKSG